MLKNIIIAFIMTAASTHSNAQVAPAKPPMKGGFCYGTRNVVSCDHLGKVTIKEIYEKGWRVVAYAQEQMNFVSLVIEEQS